MYISDCIDAIQFGLSNTNELVQVFNLGSLDQVNVKTIADVIVKEMNLHDVKFNFTGGVDGGRGWKGDVKNMLLDISKLNSMGWKPKYNSLEAVKLTTKNIVS